jgi:hypothetical protein
MQHCEGDSGIEDDIKENDAFPSLLCPKTDFEIQT